MDNRFSSAIHTLILIAESDKPRGKCVAGRYIKPVLTEIFAEMEDAFASALAGKTLADCTGGIRKTNYFCKESVDKK